MEKTILHCDMNNFFASVECLANPSMRNYPVAVSGNPIKRTGIILAKNYLAKAYGVKTGEAIWEAKQKCPNLICIAPNFVRYEEYSQKALDIYSKYTDKIESFGLDEVWLDCTDSVALFGDGRTIAKKIQDEIFDTLGLSISVGVSFSKTLAKLGSDMKKPKGITVIDRDNYENIIQNIRLDDIIMVGKRTLKKLNKLNIYTPYDLISYDKALLKSYFGVMGERLYSMIKGEDDDMVMSIDDHVTKSVGNGMTAPHDITDMDEIKEYIYFLSEMVATRMRKHNFCAYTINMSIKYADFSSHHEQKTYSLPFASCETISKYALELFDKMTRGSFSPVRALRVKCSSLIANTQPVQLSFLSHEENKKELLGLTIDRLREKYGKESINFG